MVDAPASDEWRRHLLERPEDIHALLRRTRRVAVLGIRPDGHDNRPACFVPQAVQAAGYEVVPVPVYYPDITRILGQPVYRRLIDIPHHIDLVDVFRRSEDVPAHLDDMLAARPGAVWMQSGIRHAGVAEVLARAGIDVVQDRCLMVDLESLPR